MNIQWQIYKALELIVEPVSTPYTGNSVVAAPFNPIWRSLSRRYANKLSYDQQLDHLERCLVLDGSDRDRVNRSDMWWIIWTFLNQPIFEWKSFSSRDPEIRQVADQGGRMWWYAHDPMTGQTIYLESEEEVQVWLEERLYH